MVVESFYTLVASHAMNRALGPNTSTEEAEIVKVPILAKSFIKKLIELVYLNRFCIAWVSTEGHEKHNNTQQKEANRSCYHYYPNFLIK
jgi:hypothetical protein